MHSHWADRQTEIKALFILTHIVVLALGRQPWIIKTSVVWFFNTNPNFIFIQTKKCPVCANESQIRILFLYKQTSVQSAQMNHKSEFYFYTNKEVSSLRKWITNPNFIFIQTKKFSVCANESQIRILFLYKQRSVQSAQMNINFNFI